MTENNEPPIAIIKPSLRRPFTARVSRITKASVFVERWDSGGRAHEQRFYRSHGYDRGPYDDRRVPHFLHNYDEINTWADARGGTYNRSKA